MNFLDIFNDDAFSLVSLTATINNVDHVPGRAGALVFQGVSEGIPTLSPVFESRAESLSLIQEQPRGAPPEQEKKDKSNLRSISVPHFPLEATIRADEVQNVRAFGTADQLQAVETVVSNYIRKMGQRHDLTLEYLRLGALKGRVMGPGGTVIADLFSLFGVSQETFNWDLDDALNSAGDFEDAIRIKAQELVRFMTRNAKTVLPNGYRIWAFCGDRFFDKLISHPSVKEVYNNTSEQERRLGANYAFGVFEFAGIVFENYRGTDDNSTVAIGDDEARAFLTGVPGLYAEYFAPADFMETANTIGLPRYAKVAPDQKFNRFVELHTQQNPLPICLRPRTLVRLVSNADINSEGVSE
jgi:hypothetical protein